MTKSSSGISLPIIVFLIFLILKITNQISWSWFWIFSPLWIPVALFISIFIVAVMVILLYIAYTGENISEIEKKFLKKK